MTADNARAGLLDLDTLSPQQLSDGSYLVFRRVETSKQTRHWAVQSTSGSRLGAVKFFPRWRCFVFEPLDDCVFNAGCMTDLATFCDAATDQWRQEVKARA